MDQKRTTYTLDELNHEILEGNIEEASISGPDQSIRVLCTNATNLHRGICGAHLRDIRIVIVNRKRMFEVACGVCGFYSHPSNIASYRRLGKESFVNGKNG